MLLSDRRKTFVCDGEMNCVEQRQDTRALSINTRGGVIMDRVGG